MIRLRLLRRAWSLADSALCLLALGALRIADGAVWCASRLIRVANRARAERAMAELRLAILRDDDTDDRGDHPPAAHRPAAPAIPDPAPCGDAGSLSASESAIEEVGCARPRWPRSLRWVEGGQC